MDCLQPSNARTQRHGSRRTKRSQFGPPPPRTRISARRGAETAHKRPRAQLLGRARMRLGSNWRCSGPPSFAHECRRRMPTVARSAKVGLSLSPERATHGKPCRVQAKDAPRSGEAAEVPSREGGLPSGQGGFEFLHLPPSILRAETNNMSWELEQICPDPGGIPNWAEYCTYPHACAPTNGSSMCSRVSATPPGITRA